MTWIIALLRRLAISWLSRKIEKFQDKIDKAQDKLNIKLAKERKKQATFNDDNEDY